MLCSIYLLLAAFPVQDPADAPPPVAPDTPAASDPDAAGAEALRSRIHDMRMNLLLGGERVRAAEGEAVAFYGNKIETVDRRMDSLQVDLSEKRANYDVLLKRALGSSSPDGRRSAMAEASVLRASISELEAEQSDLDSKRADLAQLVTTVEARDRERDKLVAQLETSGSFDMSFGLPFTSIGLAPVTGTSPSGSPLDDSALVGDLLERDPTGARRVLFEMDPVGYWQRFPLQPPRELLLETLDFPPADLPGSR